MNPLPPGQQRVYAAILAFWIKHRYPPTVRDIIAALGIKSTNGIAYHLRALQAKGFIDMDKERARSIVPLVAGNGERLDWDGGFREWLKGGTSHAH